MQFFPQKNTGVIPKVWIWFMVGLVVISINLYFYFDAKSKAEKEATEQRAIKDAETTRANQIARDLKLQREADLAREANTRRQEAAERRRIADAAERKERDLQLQKEAQLTQETAEAQYIDRHINTNRSKNLTGKTIAIAVVENNQMQVGVVQDALESHFRNDSVQLFTSFLKPAFFTDGMVEDILNGTREIPSRLKLDKYIDALVLAKYRIEFTTTDIESQRLTTANIKCTVTLLPFTENVQAHTWELIASGNGFKTTTAQANANEKLIQQIKESSMALNK